MRVLLLCLFVSGALAWPSFFQDAPVPNIGHRQKDVNTLLYRVTESIQDPALKAAADAFHPLADKSHYTDDGHSIQLLMEEIDNHRVLQQHHWFSLFNTRQREEALMLFEAITHCKSWEYGLNVAAYFRSRMNEGEFVYAIYAAVIHHPLGEGIILPPLYEVTPHMFTNSEVINKAYTAQMTHTPGKFAMTFTGSKKNPEQRVAYFGEDIGLNCHHVTWHLDFPFWWKDSYGYHLDRKGELFYWVHHQLTVRFDAERLSNHLNLVDELYWNKPIAEGFAPHTTYRYGGEFPSRPDNVEFEDVDGIVRVRDMIIHETRIRDAIAHGYITKADGSHLDINNEHGIDHLGDIVESSVYSPNTDYYGALHNEAHIILGRQSDPHGKFNLPPGVMEHFETATRDPAFFRLHKYMDNLFKEHKDSLPPYTKDQIEFTGIGLESVSVEGTLETFFEDFEFDLSNAVDSNAELGNVQVSATIPRLNHEPFALNFEVMNNGNEKHGIVRVYLCPRKDANGVIFSFDEGRWHCIEMDKFWTKLSPGSNHIHRASSQSSVTVPDIPSFASLIEAANTASVTGGSLGFEGHDRACGIPNRLLLPKGTIDGMEFILAVAVTEADEHDNHGVLENDDVHHSHSQCGIRGGSYPDHKPMGYPLDRHIEDERIILSCSNVKYTTVTVTHNDHHEHH